MYVDLWKQLIRKIDTYIEYLYTLMNVEFDWDDERSELAFEMLVAKVFEYFLTDRLGVCKGYVTDRSGKKTGRGIIIYEKDFFPSLKMLKNNLLLDDTVPIEAVHAYISTWNNLVLDNNERTNFMGAISDMISVKHMALDEYFSNDDYDAAYCAIISRKNYLRADIKSKDIKEGELSADDTYKVLNEVLMPKLKFLPDLIIAGKRVMAYPAKNEIRLLDSDVKGVEHVALAHGILDIMKIINRRRIIR